MKICLCLLLMLLSLIAKAANELVIPLQLPICHDVQWKQIKK
jgi:hypothetical protein